MKKNEALLICAGALDRYGERHQIIKCLEEMGELSRALSKYLNEDEDAGLDNVREEIADVNIMLAQMEMIFDGVAIGEKREQKLRDLSLRMAGWRSEKLSRLAESLKGEGCGGDACRL